MLTKGKFRNLRVKSYAYFIFGLVGTYIYNNVSGLRSALMVSGWLCRLLMSAACRDWFGVVLVSFLVRGWLSVGRGGVALMVSPCRRVGGCLFFVSRCRQRVGIGAGWCCSSWCRGAAFCARLR